MLDRPYVKILEEHQSLAPIIDMQMSINGARSSKNQLTLQNKHAELMVVSGSMHSSYINIVNKGVSIHDFLFLEDLAPL